MVAPTRRRQLQIQPEVANPEPTKSVSRSGMSLAERRDIFGSSDDSSLRRSRSLESDRGGGKSQFNDVDEYAVMLHDQDDGTGRGIVTSIEITQETRDRRILRIAPEKKAWLPPQRVFDRPSRHG